MEQITGTGKHLMEFHGCLPSQQMISPNLARGALFDNVLNVHTKPPYLRNWTTQEITLLLDNAHDLKLLDGANVLDFLNMHI